MFYLKTVSNIESSTQLQLKTNISLLPHTFHVPKITSSTTKYQQIAWNKEEKYSVFHLPENLQRKNDVYTHPNYPLQ